MLISERFTCKGLHQDEIFSFMSYGEKIKNTKKPRENSEKYNEENT